MFRLYTSFVALICTLSIPVQGAAQAVQASSPAVPATVPAVPVNLVAAGDSLNTGHGLAGFAPPGYPNRPPPGAWPEVLAALQAVRDSITVTNTSVDGYTLAQTAALYASAVHSLSPAVTGRPGILAISIFGNDAARIGPGLTYADVTAYETAYAAYLSTARADGWKIMFLEQWEQATRQQFNGARVAFNEWNRQHADYYIPTATVMRDPTDRAAYLPDGLHETATASAGIALAAQQVLLRADGSSQTAPDAPVSGAASPGGSTRPIP